MITLSDLCREVNNWFVVSQYRGQFTISGGIIDLSDMITDGSIQDGQYFLIQGSVFNDGVHQHPASDLDDERFNGTVSAMAVPKEFLALFTDINTWLEKYSSDLQKPYQSESFGGYSYSLKGGLSDASGGGSEPYKAMFSSRLAKWRKLR